VSTQSKSIIHATQVKQTVLYHVHKSLRAEKTHLVTQRKITENVNFLTKRRADGLKFNNVTIQFDV
jgi:hypothetical protein